MHAELFVDQGEGRAEAVFVAARDVFFVEPRSSFRTLEQDEALELFEEMARSQRQAVRQFAYDAELIVCLESLDDTRLLEEVRASIARGEVVAVQRAEVGDRPTAAVLRQRALERELWACMRGPIIWRGVRYKLVAGIDLANMPNSIVYDVLGRVEAEKILTEIIKAPGTSRRLAELLGQARDRLSKDWRRPFQPDGLLMLRQHRMQHVSKIVEGPTHTPSELKALADKLNPHAAPAPVQRVFNARWGSSPVRCGDEVQLFADTENIPPGTAATFTVATSTGIVGMVSSTTEVGSFKGTWVTVQISPDAVTSKLMFAAQANGLSDTTPILLDFFPYPDTPGQMVVAKMVAQQYAWQKAFYVQFVNRTMVVSVWVHLINRLQPEPPQKKKESFSDWRQRCDAVPVGGPVEAAFKNIVLQRVHTIFNEHNDFHRSGCKRGEGCLCSPTNKCCKFPFQLNLILTDTSGPGIHEVNVWPGGGRANAGNWYRVENPVGLVYAHEVGHLIGFYDEYPGGALGPPPWKANFPASLMCAGWELFDYHLEEFRSRLASWLGEGLKVKRR